MAAILEKLFGTSPAPTIIGYLTGFMIVLKEAIDSQGTPHDLSGWLFMGVGVAIAVLGRVTKQTNVTNAADPLPKAATVQSILPPPPAA